MEPAPLFCLRGPSVGAPGSVHGRVSAPRLSQEVIVRWIEGRDPRPGRLPGAADGEVAVDGLQVQLVPAAADLAGGALADEAAAVDVQRKVAADVAVEQRRAHPGAE